MIEGGLRIQVMIDQYFHRSGSAENGFHLFHPAHPVEVEAKDDRCSIEMFDALFRLTGELQDLTITGQPLQEIRIIAGGDDPNGVPLGYQPMIQS